MGTQSWYLADILRARGEGPAQMLEESCIFGLRTVEAALIHRCLRSEITQEPVAPPFVIDSLTRMLAG